MTLVRFAHLIGVDTLWATGVLWEIALLEAGGCSCCCARRILALTAGSQSPVVQQVCRNLERLVLFSAACPACESEAA